jgi:hypothetical protein
MGEMRYAYSILVRKPERKIQFVRPRSSWEDNIRMDIRQISAKLWNGLIWLRIGTIGWPL